MSKAPVAATGSNSAKVLRTQVAACTRLLNMEGILHYSGHISVRVPGTDTIYIQSRNESRAEVTPESILLVGLDGTVLEGDGKPPSELVIHTAIYKARPDVGSIIHNHMEIATAFTLAKNVKLQVVSFAAARWASGIPVMRDAGHFKTKEHGESLVKELGNANALLLRAHGLVLTSESAPAIMCDTIHFQDNARAQKEAMELGEVEPLTPAEIKRVEQYSERDHHVRKMWNYYAKEGVKKGVLPKEWDVKLEGH